MSKAAAMSDGQDSPKSEWTVVDRKTLEQSVIEALKPELRLVLSLAGVVAKHDSPIEDADAMIVDLAGVVLDALHSAARVVIEPRGANGGDG
ncbi:hypothetical protein BJD60_gp64 [Gordonia phage Schnabeltier]|uniref:Uncharacterized protein n=1 Tax=Gordonia phage Schnabeltier TaxID=1821561 RepID=A0A142KA52_9CAUD|nr:hypothetical protein BJD60_gp64 [Gordonia phage Schnabeltier]AMS02985.1 hypothetical protein SEA_SCHNABELTIER_64 [Gordonia phage Schnabeltier]